MSFYYRRRKYQTVEVLEMESIEDAKHRALRDFARGENLPLHISNESGRQVVPHCKLREWIYDQSKLGEFNKQW